MKVLVCGGRNYRSPAQVWWAMECYHQCIKPITELMHGGAEGVDRFATEWAASRHPEIKRYVCKAKWESHGKAAGPMRNQRMLEWNPDLVIAFPGGSGTADMVSRATKVGVEIWYPFGFNEASRHTKEEDPVAAAQH